MWLSLDRISSENSCQACKLCFARTCGAYKIWTLCCRVWPSRLFQMDRGGHEPWWLPVCISCCANWRCQSAIELVDVIFSQSETVTLSVPVSKTDWMAKGWRRSWSCLCKLNRPCPLHIMKEYHDCLMAEGITAGPWIRTLDGQICSKHIISIIYCWLHQNGSAESGWFGLFRGMRSE